MINTFRLNNTIRSIREDIEGAITEWKAERIIKKAIEKKKIAEYDNFTIEQLEKMLK